jgi:hypothetical protein
MHLKGEALHFISVHSESVLQRAEALELEGELGDQVRPLIVTLLHSLLFTLYLTFLRPRPLPFT